MQPLTPEIPWFALTRRSLAAAKRLRSSTIRLRSDVNQTDASAVLANRSVAFLALGSGMDLLQPLGNISRF